MADSPIHITINDIRKNYVGKKLSLIDVRIIEDMYHICSIANVRNNNTAFLRITSYGLEGVIFEDVVFDFDGVVKREEDTHTFIFNLSKALYDLVYGIQLIDENMPVLKDYLKPSVSYTDLRKDVKELKEKIGLLELKIKDIQNGKPVQETLFDLDNSKD